MTRIRMLLGALGAALALAACGPPAASPDRTPEPARPAAPKSITVAVLSNPPTFSQRINGTGAQSFGFLIIERLVNPGPTLDAPDGSTVPVLAEAVPTVANGLWKVSPDGRMETSWRIREGARWHDGTVITAEDLLFTLEVEQDKDLPFREIPLAKYTAVEAIRAPDARTLVITWKAPYIQADSFFNDIAPLPKHLLEQSYRESKATFLSLPYWTDAFVGAGPFRRAEFERDIRVVLQAFDGYVLGRPKLDQVLVRFIPDLNALTTNVLAGEVDAALDDGIPVEVAKLMVDQWGQGRMAIVFTNWMSLYPQFINPDPPLLRDVRFRRALLHATDREELGASIGFGPVAHAIVRPGSSQYRAVEPQIVRYDYDPRRAAQLIEEMGYRRGADGFFRLDSPERGAASQPLSVEILFTTRGPNLRVAAVVADTWQGFGVGAKAVPIPPSRTADNEYIYTRPGFQMLGQGAAPRELVRFVTTAIPLPATNFLGSNRARYSSPELDAFIDRYFATIPLTERNQVLGQIVRHMTEQVNVMGLYHYGSASVVSNRLEQLVVDDLPTTGSNAHLWDVR